MKTTAHFRDVIRDKHPGIDEAWILRVMAEPMVERRQADGRYALWDLVPEAQNRALRVITLEDRETVHNAFFDRSFLRGQPQSPLSQPAAPPRAVKIRYFPDTDTVYIDLADRVSSSSEAVSGNLIVDFDALGKPVGVTLEHYSQISNSSTIQTLLPFTPLLQPA